MAEMETKKKKHGSTLAWQWIEILKFCCDLLTYFGKRVSRKSKPLDILHSSCNFIVVNKEPDLVINSNDPMVKSLQLSLIDEFPSLANPDLRHGFHFIHRLDFVTSGVICIGLSKKASSAAAAAFQKRLVSKYYLAILRGHVSAELLEINVPIGEMKSEISGSHRMTVSRDPDKCVNPRTSVTLLLVLERGLFYGYPATKVILKPITGRRHQLRVHCAHVGHTIVGDFTYSQKRDVIPKRTYLHAFRTTDLQDLAEIELARVLSAEGWYQRELTFLANLSLNSLASETPGPIRKRGGRHHPPSHTSSKKCTATDDSKIKNLCRQIEEKKSDVKLKPEKKQDLKDINEIWSKPYGWFVVPGEKMPMVR